MADKNRFEITLRFMAQADRDRRFYGTITVVLVQMDIRLSGTIHRGFDSDGHPVIPDRIKADNGSVMAMAGHQDVLGSRLDELLKMATLYCITLLYLI